MIFSEAKPAVNAKSTARLRLRRFRRGLGAEFSRQAIGRRLNDLGAAVQGLVGQAPDRTGNTKRPNHLAGKIRDRRSEAKIILPSAVQWAGRTTPTRSVS